MSKPDISRRGFLGATAATAAFTIVPRHVLGGAQHTAPSEKLNIAGIGVGGMGKSNLSQLETENIVALCDVDHAYAAETFKKYPQAKVYSDYREMLDKEKDIDAVMIATPDHTHAVISMAAMRRGKHVYCQKPLTHDIYEARMLAKAARETGVTTQMGIQGHSMEGGRLICEWIADGAIGEVREVDAWCSLSYYPWGHADWSSKWSRRPAGHAAGPGDAQLGPVAGSRPAAAVSSGLPSGRVALLVGFRLRHDGRSRRAHARPGRLGPEAGASDQRRGHVAGPQSRDPSYRLGRDVPIPGARGSAAGEADLVRRHAAARPPELEDGRRMGNVEGGSLFKGAKGKLVAGVYGEDPRLIPESRMKEYKLPPKTIPRVAGSHEQDWVRACKAGKRAGADFEYSGLLTEICLLGNVAKRVDARIEWDGPNMKVTNLPEANKYVRTTYRDGWKL